MASGAFRTVIAALGAAFLLASCKEPEVRHEGEIVAVVDGEPIRVEELERALAAEAAITGDALDDPAWRDERRRRLLDDLVERKLLEQAAVRRGIRVSEAEIDRALLRLRADYPGEAYEDLLSSQKLGPTELRDRLRRQLLLERLLSREVYARVAVTDAEIDLWLEQNPDFLRSRPERVRASQIVVRTEEEARRILAELRKGASFAELAARHSLSPDAKVGGDLGWFARGEMPPPFEEVCFKLAPGEVSDVVESEYGFHLFLVQEKDRGQEVDEAERRKEAEARILREKALAAQAEFLARLRAEASIEVIENVLARVGERR